MLSEFYLKKSSSYVIMLLMFKTNRLMILIVFHLFLFWGKVFYKGREHWQG